MLPPPTVFWPDDVHTSGFCFGWTKPAFCVAGVLNDISEAEHALAALDSNPPWMRLSQSCGANPVILGKCTFIHGGPRHPTLELNGTESYTIIYYRRHAATSLRFYALETLDPTAEERSAGQKARNAAYATSVGHDFTRPRTPSNPGGLNDLVINQFNAAKTVDTLLKRNPSRQRLPAELSKYLFDIMDASLYVPKRVLALLRVPASLSYLKDFSSTVQQLDVRAEQAAFLTREVTPLRQHGLTSVSVYSARYTNFFNTVWLILNDITIGVAFGSFLCENNVVLARWLNHLVEGYLVDWVRGALHWLDSWPAGLKLNTELSRFYSHAFSDLVGMWGSVLHLTAPHLPALLFTFGTLTAGGLGMTAAIALASDLLALWTAHIYVCYFVARVLYASFLRTGGSLWNLFRGKRFNVLRNRTDAWAYDTDQLLFGTILFTLLAFLFPTVLAYYALFALLRLATILVNAGLETQLAFMNHFPLFALMLRAKDPWRLPGGIYFAAEYNKEIVPVLAVKNKPVPFSTIFVQYIRLWSRMAAHYNPLRLLWYVLRGERLVAIPRYHMRYFT
ncbi:N-acetylglucosaminyl transferase component-domain-containing protein [Mycena alexandri]|uniref:N-acetylglucosaminyl transferase component-domain-containing protein n=1 Tax=Mycena alexandri TaxID=1745969 RepID=A0AAD6X0T3_9AGAR|nr:N-acetylglucosaminyl transferase component-domain-containing protein [Mycena alexandri]